MKTMHATLVLLAAGVLLTAAAFAQEPPPPPPMPEFPGEEETLSFVEVNLPEVFSQLQRIKKEDPREYPIRVEMFSHMLFRYRELQANAPELAAGLLEAHRLDRQAEILAEKIRQTQDPDQKTRMKQKLKEMLDKIFELRMAERELEVKNLERELNHIQTLLNTRRQAKEMIIDQHLRDLTFQGDEALGWW